MPTERILRINGRNGADSIIDPRFPDLAMEALNVDRYEGMMCRRRAGTTSLSTAGGTAFTTQVESLVPFSPIDDPVSARLLAWDSVGVCKINTGGVWSDMFQADAIQQRPQDINGVSFGGRLYIAADTLVDRMHCYDTNIVANGIRRVGLAAPAAAPTVADFGAGAYAATTRYYRIRFVHISATTGAWIRKSEPSASVAFTPSGAGAAARVTRPAIVNESETHWVLEGSVDNANFYGIAGAVLATTTIDDSNAPSSYPALFALSEPIGFYTVPPSAKVVISDGNRLVFLGSWETAATSRYWWTPVIDPNTTTCEAERIVVTTYQKNYGDLGERDDDGGITGAAKPLKNGIIYVFKYRAVWQLVPTGDPIAPYNQRKLTDKIGNVTMKMVVTGQDRKGNTCVYFWDPDTGPWRLGANGLQYLGRDVEDIRKTVNLDADNSANAGIVGHAVWHKEKRQLWVWLATGGATSPNVKLVFDPAVEEADEVGNIRKGWFKHTGNSALARCSTMFADTVAATMSRALKPYIGRAAEPSKIQKCDSSATTDDGATFQAYVETRPIVPANVMGKNLGAGAAVLVAKAATGVTIQLTYIRDYGIESPTSSVSLTPAGAEPYVVRTFDGAGVEGAMVLQVRIGDGGASGAAWTLDALFVPVTGNEDKGNV